MLFFIRFRGQLRRTRPELITSLEDTVADAAAAAGGSVEIGRKVLSASFDESRIGFWLDIVIFLEKVHKVLQKNSSELYGHSLVLGHNILDMPIQKIGVSLSRESSPGSPGIWCSEEVRSALEQYAVFGKLKEAEETPDRGAVPDGYRELKDFRVFGKNRVEFPFREKIKQILISGTRKNTLLLGPEFLGKRDGIFYYCESILEDVPPLAARFGAGGRGLICFVDAYTKRIRSFISETLPKEIAGSPLAPGQLITSDSLLNELDGIYNLLFRERLREEWSPYFLDSGRQFIRLLLFAYSAAIKIKKTACVFILEDLSAADSRAVEIFMEIYSSLEEQPLIIASDKSAEISLKNWGTLFPRILKFSSEDFSIGGKFDLPREHARDLWEVLYNIYLLGRYFPPHLFPQLFEEQGLSRDMYFRSLGILAAHGVVIPDDPRPRIINFSFRAERVLAERKDKIRSTVNSCILNWVLSGRIRPCFNLLRILSELGEGAGDVLILRSLKADVLNGTWEGIEEARLLRHFAPLVGTGNVTVLSYIYKTSKVLVWGKKEEILEAFSEPLPSMALDDDKPCYGGYQAQMQINLAAYHIGCHNIDAASEAVRKAMLLNRDLGEDAVPAYRLFSLVNLSRQRLDDALEYISFAVEQAERTEQGEELILTCFYASSINFLHGNLSRAERLAVRAEQIAVELGQSGWYKRVKFLRGRLYFELGRYRDALDIFESLESVSDTVKAWIYRMNNYLGRFSPLDDANKSPDFDVFVIEAAYMASDYERAISLAEHFLSSPETEANDGFLYTEQPDWESGFSQCEDMFRPGKLPGKKLAWIYKNMAHCALNPAVEEKNEILGSMQRFMRDELLPDSDPNDAFYFYAWYCMLRDIRAAQVDMNTVVSMAYKRLQRRAGKIDDIGTKQTFLNMSRWNSTLCFAARENKII